MKTYLMNVKIPWRPLAGAAILVAAAILPGGLIALLVVNAVRRWRRRRPARPTLMLVQGGGPAVCTYLNQTKASSSERPVGGFHASVFAAWRSSCARALASSK
jgi:hypothetical protein